MGCDCRGSLTNIAVKSRIMTGQVVGTGGRSGWRWLDHTLALTARVSCFSAGAPAPGLALPTFNPLRCLFGGQIRARVQSRLLAYPPVHRGRVT